MHMPQDSLCVCVCSPRLGVSGMCAQFTTLLKLSTTPKLSTIRCEKKRDFVAKGGKGTTLGFDIHARDLLVRFDLLREPTGDGIVLE